jgi:hypothetical protein
MSDLVTVVIPSIPLRVDNGLLDRALASVKAQTSLPKEVVVEFDYDREGAGIIRTRGLAKVTTPYVAFLDDDDEFKPEHIDLLLDTMQAHGADYVYPWYDVVGGTDPMSQFENQPWDNEHPHQTTITTLVRTDLAQSVGFATPPMEDPNGGGIFVGGEDWRFTLGCMDQGAKIVHLPRRTWRWHHHGANTSGLANRW